MMRSYPASSVLPWLDSDVVGRQHLQRGQAPTRKILWPHKDGADVDGTAIRQHERIWRRRLEGFIGSVNEELPAGLRVCQETTVPLRQDRSLTVNAAKFSHLQASA